MTFPCVNLIQLVPSQSNSSGIDEMPKSQIEKRKRNMESTSRVSRREKRNIEICFLVREENENFCPKNGEILNIFSSFEMRREIQKRKRNPPFPFLFFFLLSTQNNTELSF